MNSLVGYGSSDDEDDIQPEKPAKIAKIEPASTNHTAKSPETRPAPPAPDGPSPVVRDLNADATPRESDRISPAPGPLPAPGPGPAPAFDREKPPTMDSPPLSPVAAERQRIYALTMPPVPNFSIPDSPPPPAAGSAEADALAASTAKFAKFLALKQQGTHFNQRLQDSTALRNPSLLPKLMEWAGMDVQRDAYSSALPDEVAVPALWPDECYVENLVKRNERTLKTGRAKGKDKVDFVPARTGEDGERGT